jgi:hypothetical protein
MFMCRLTICTHHCVADGNGNEQIIRHFATLCTGGKLSEDDIKLGNADQNTIFPPIKPGEDIETFEVLRCPSTLDAPRGEWPPSPSTGLWKTFRFTKASIAALKSQASTLCSTDYDIKYISSNDAVSTFIWTRIASLRSSSSPKGSVTQMVRAMNGRRRLDPQIPPGYLGHSILCCYTSLPIEDVVNGDFSATTINVRRALLQFDDKKIRSFFHLLKNLKDKTTINYGAAMTDADIMVSSWASQILYDTSFGAILGKPVSQGRKRWSNS